MAGRSFLEEWGTFKKPADRRGFLVAFASHLEYSLGRDQHTAAPRDLCFALALAARDFIMERWVRTRQVYEQQDVKRVYYLSAEYLMGRALTNNLVNLGLYDVAREAMAEVGLEIADLAEHEPDAGLGNGGLGRLAACFLDSMATLAIPAMGYGIRYEFGIFDQVIRGLRQMELPEAWLKHGYPWEIPRPDQSCTVRFYGRIRETFQTTGQLRVEWLDAREVIGLPYDTPVNGYRNDTVNTLRLWSARASKELDLSSFQNGNYLMAVEEKNASENISKVLYPPDDTAAGRELRLKQEYFFVSCSIQDIVRRYLGAHRSFDAFPDRVAIQMNDTHPSLAVPELMRVLMDDHGVSWDRAWELTVAASGYTNHTLMPEAMERWSVDLMTHLLPRHMQIVYEINRRFLREVSIRYVGDAARLERTSIIEERPERQVRMAHLAMVGSRSINGVAELHLRLMRERALRDFAELFPERFHAKTNGITPRRWLMVANPRLAALVTDAIGEGWVRDLRELRRLEPLATDAAFGEAWRLVKHANKSDLAKAALKLTGVNVDASSLFDVQVKRIHEYKRQLLNVLHVVYLWLRLREERGFRMAPRTFFLGGKAAPGYAAAKDVVRLACHVGATLNKDPATRSFLKVVFLPNYRVSLAEKIIPAANVSQHISTAGYEASGTSNMKFCLNGAAVVGTLDGANVEIREDVGAENVFSFGLSAEEVVELRPQHRPRAFLEADPLLARAVALVGEGFFSPEEPAAFAPLVARLLEADPYMVLADFADYHRCQMAVDAAYRDEAAFTRISILNVARIAKFSSDRTVEEYNRDVWRVPPVPISREAGGPQEAGFDTRDRSPA